MCLTEFILARIAEDEEFANAASLSWWSEDDLLAAYDALSEDSHRMADARLAARHDPARVLAECEAKRRIVDNYSTLRAAEQAGESVAGVATVALHRSLRYLASVFADHPDYREEWKP